MAPVGFSDGVEALENKLLVLTLAIYAVIITSFGMLIGKVLEYLGGSDFNPAMADAAAVIVAAACIGFPAALFVSMVLVCKWIFWAHANLQAIGIASFEFTPRWAVIWYFVPIANLFKPYQAMRELWHISHELHDGVRDGAPTLVTFWWFATLGSVMLAIASFLVEGDEGAGAAMGSAALLLLIGSANLLLHLIRKITEAQRDGVRTAALLG